MKRAHAINITVNGRPTRWWLRQRAWGRQVIKRSGSRTTPGWLLRVRLQKAPWAGRAVRRHMQEVDAVMAPAFRAVFEALDREIPWRLQNENEERNV